MDALCTSAFFFFLSLLNNLSVTYDIISQKCAACIDFLCCWVVKWCRTKIPCQDLLGLFSYLCSNIHILKALRFYYCIAQMILIATCDQTIYQLLHITTSVRII